jgi:hypothetical protein
MASREMEIVAVSYGEQSNGKCGCYLRRVEKWNVWLLVMASRQMESVVVSYGEQSNGKCGCKLWRAEQWKV